ncbi:MAG TPA: Re/Si-specific NAD(P)(+) transhydrogenase subunit alpha [Thermoanaerobaculia bacterium]|nr:Re/Si-specific NAD(P)(+) transhydrogenase subunit alpha [Thermoanaerobaculia bacterium]
MKVLVAKEQRAGETRVAATPETVKKMVKAGLAVAVEEGAGLAAHFDDDAFREAGAEVAAAGAGWSAADVVLTVNAPGAPAVGTMREGALLVGLLAPHHNPEMVRAAVERRVTALAMELVPRISRAQSMDALSSQASIAGYKAVALAAWRLPRYFPLLMTAAGTVPPAKVVVMGAGVAGLQAIATARRLGAQVEVSDIRPAVKEQVQSLGGKFIELPLEESGEGQGGYAKEMGEDFLRRQREIVARHLAAADVVVTTALVPGKPAPRLVTREMIAGMKRGAVVVDLAIEQGGNVELSQADEEVVADGVLILAPSNLAATMAHDASVLYARNVFALLKEMVSEGEMALDLEDEVVAGSLLTHAGQVHHAPTAERLGTGAPAAAPGPARPANEPANHEVTVE